MAGRTTKLTAEVHQQTVGLIRAGSFEWVAAEAAGIHRATFYRWLERGERDRAGPYRAFREDVRQARALARATAETEVRKGNPFNWLRYGPGRAHPGEPGWTDSVEISARVESADPRLERFSDDDLERLARLAERTLGRAESPSPR